MGEGSGRGSGRVRLLSAIAGRVGLTFRRVGSGSRKVTRGQLCMILLISRFLENTGSSGINPTSDMRPRRTVYYKLARVVFIAPDLFPITTY